MGQRALVLEWMDTDLWNARMHPRSQDPNFQRLVARSILEALVVFADIKGTHTDITPNNVLISGIDTPTPVVKVGDLGNLCGEGIDWVRLQGLAIRAPEVWSGLGCWPASDVWSLGVTVYLTYPNLTTLADDFQMLHWLARRCVFGASDKVVEGLTESWCIAKVKRLVGPLHPPVNPEYMDEFEAADVLESNIFQTPEMPKSRKFITARTVRQELESVPSKCISQECMDFIQSLLVIDHTRRPSARESLSHPFIAEIR